MKRIVAVVCCSLAGTLGAGCAVDSSSLEEPEALGEAESALVVSNALNPNALNPNALNPNSLLPAALASILDPGEAGDLSRQLLSYTVSCALSPTQSFVFVWFDNLSLPHLEVLTGLLGLAPDWASGPLTVVGQRWITACLVSRVNWYGVPVTISSRGKHTNLRTPGLVEQLLYTREEGAFFGNLFDAPPTAYACYTAANVDHSRSLFRDCAAGHLDESGAIEGCGPVQILGDCADYCQPLTTEGGYHPSCAPESGGVATDSVITTFLP